MRVKRKQEKILFITVLVALLVLGCTRKPTEEPIEVVCDPIIIPASEMDSLVLNGIHGEVDSYLNYELGRNWGFVNEWINGDNAKDYLIFVDEETFVWLRVGEDDYGYLYAGTYEYDEERVHLVVYANNEVIEEYNYEYWFTTYIVRRKGHDFDFNILHLRDDNGNVIEYYETETPVLEM